MSPPNSRHSEPRNVHMASFSFEMPVLVTWLKPWLSPASGSWMSATSGVGAAMSVNERSLLVGSGGTAGFGFGGGFLAVSGVIAVTRIVVAMVPGVRIDRRLHDPAVDATHHADAAEDGEPQRVDQAVGD